MSSGVDPLRIGTEPRADAKRRVVDREFADTVNQVADILYGSMQFIEGLGCT